MTLTIKELGHVVLYVTNLERSVHFYKDILGFPCVASARGMAVFSSGRTHHELLLIEIGGKPLPAGRVQPGLYHIGFKIGDDEKTLKDALTHLHKHDITIVGTADHTVTKSIYVLDPDNNELELYVDTSDIWKKDPKSIIAPTKQLNIK